MARQEKRGGRVHGPYAYRRQWRIVVVDREGGRNHLYFGTEEDAKQVVRSLRREFRKATARPLKEALVEYELHMRDDLRNKLGSVKTTTARLTQFFKDFDDSVEDLDDTECARRYEALRFHRTPRGTRIADDTQLNTLAQVKTFLGWCVKMKLAKVNPAANVEGKGRHRHGKPQLRIDEARRWQDVAMRIATTGESEREREGALKAMLPLRLGVRENEVLRREVRDVDDGGHLLWIPSTKTEAGRRTLEVPDDLVPLLAAQANGRKGTEPLFRYRSKGVARKWVKRICKKAGVMVVGAQSMRGLHATLAVDAGITSHAVAAALGHRSFTTTARSYAKAEAVTAAKQRRTTRVLSGKTKVANGSGVRPLEHGKLHNFLHNSSGSSCDATKGGSGK